jgi:hypothetical protein
MSARDCCLFLPGAYLIFDVGLPYLGADFPIRSRVCMGGRKRAACIRLFENLKAAAEFRSCRTQGRRMRFSNLIRNAFASMALALVPAASFAGVFVSLTIAPPALPVYKQPICPGDGYLWNPGYWAYGDEGYYWVPGVWVRPPQVGLLWTPGYWGWGGGVYVFHPGYWGPHVGFYGGVNYGFGYGGAGFGGGRWEGGHFAYNTAVVNVNRTVIHNTYIDNTVIVRNNFSRTSFNGGNGGI